MNNKVTTKRGGSRKKFNTEVYKEKLSILNPELKPYKKARLSKSPYCR